MNSQQSKVDGQSAGSPELHREMSFLAKQAQKAARRAVVLSAEQKNRVLEAMAAELEASRAQVQEANQKEVREGRDNGLTEAMCDRLLLSDARYQSMVQGLRDLIQLKDPVGEELQTVVRPNGLKIRKVRVPIGVIVIVYESRPNVTADAAGLCVKTSNAVILRGGREAFASNKAIAEALQRGAAAGGLPENMIQFVTTTDRAAVRELVCLEDFVDLVIPRGGEGLIRAVSEMSRVPVLKHYKGVCHTYVDKSAEMDMAMAICENAKCQRPGVCNAMETLLVHEDIAPTFLPKLAERFNSLGVLVKGDEDVRNLVPDAQEAGEEDWHAEYLDLTLAVRVVSSLEQAVEHVNTYGSQHTDAIVAESKEAQRSFAELVDSGVVMINASSRFNDGGEFGMGAEMGISTDKLHARGPVGPEELTTYKYVVEGSGQIRS